MSDLIRVTVFKRAGRDYYEMQYRHPSTGAKVRRSTGTNNRRDADRAAERWQREIEAGRRAPVRVSWAHFRERYESEVATGLAESTDKKICGVLNTVERILAPRWLHEMTAERISKLQAKLRAEGRAETTIKSHLSHLLAALNWARSVKLLIEVPEITMPRRAKAAKLMKGRPIALEEFERMLAAVPKVVGDKRAPSWRQYLEGLWLSGLRLAESLELYWDRSDRLCVDMAGQFPMLRIPAELEKGHRDRLLPMAPEFAELLAAVPVTHRRGRIFKPMADRLRSERLSELTVSRTISAIGEKAGVKVDTDPRTGAIKFASAHDLRRSFGARWASRVMPQVLKELMRHESIETTLRYYVGRNAQATAGVLWEAHRTAAAGLGTAVGAVEAQK